MLHVVQYSTQIKISMSMSTVFFQELLASHYKPLPFLNIIYVFFSHVVERNMNLGYHNNSLMDAIQTVTQLAYISFFVSFPFIRTTLRLQFK